MLVREQFNVFYLQVTQTVMNEILEQMMKEIE